MITRLIWVEEEHLNIKNLNTESDDSEWIHPKLMSENAEKLNTFAILKDKKKPDCLARLFKEINL